MSRPTHRHTITASHPNAPGTRPLIVVTYDQLTLDRLTADLAARGFVDVKVVTTSLP